MILFKKNTEETIVYGTKYDRNGGLAIGAYIVICDPDNHKNMYGNGYVDRQGYFEISLSNSILKTKRYLVKFIGSNLLQDYPPDGDWEMLDLISNLPIEPADVNGLLRETQTEIDSNTRQIQYAVAVNSTKLTFKNNGVSPLTITINAYNSNYLLAGFSQHVDEQLTPENFIPINPLIANVDNVSYTFGTNIVINPGQLVLMKLTGSIISNAYKVRLVGTNLNDANLKIKIVTQIAADEIDAGRIRVEEGITIQDSSGKGTIIDLDGMRLVNSGNTIIGEFRNTSVVTAITGFGNVDALMRLGKDGTDWGMVVDNAGQIYSGGWAMKKDMLVDSSDSVFLSPKNLALGDGSSVYGSGLGIKNTSGDLVTYVTGNEFWRFGGPASMPSISGERILDGSFIDATSSKWTYSGTGSARSTTVFGGHTEYARIVNTTANSFVSNNFSTNTFTLVPGRSYTLSLDIASLYTSSNYTIELYSGVTLIKSLNGNAGNYWRNIKISFYATIGFDFLVKVINTNFTALFRDLLVDNISVLDYAPYTEVSAIGYVTANSPDSYIRFGQGIAEIKVDTLDVNNMSVYGDFTVYGNQIIVGETVLTSAFQVLNYNGSSFPSYSGFEIDNTGGNTAMVFWDGTNWYTGVRTSSTRGSQSAPTSSSRILTMSSTDLSPTFTGLNISGLTASRVLTTDASKNLFSSSVTTTELGYVSGVTSAIQTQLNAKEPTITAGTTLQYRRGDKTWQTLNTSVVPELTNLYYTDVRADARITLQKGAVNGLATLDSGGKIPSSQLPAIAVVDVYVVASQAAQLALTAQEGDVAVRTDLNKSYINNGGTSGTMTDWQELLTPTDAVLSVNGFTGAVTLTTTNISEGTNQYFTTARVLSTALTGYSVGTNTALAATDAILAAMGKIQGQINARLTANQTITLSGDVSGSGTTAITTTIGANKVTLAMMAQITTNSILGRITASTGNVEVLTAANVKTILSLSNVENTALSTWAGTTNITTLGTIATGTWNATTISTGKGGTGLTGIGTANQILGVNSGATGLEYKTINGTTNQVTVTHGANSVTLSLPQNIHTGATPTFASLTTTSGISVGTTLTIPPLATSTSGYGIKFGTSYATQIAQNSNTSAHFEFFHNTLVERSGADASVYKWVTSHATFGSRGIRFDYGVGIVFFADNAVTTAGSAFTPTLRMTLTNAGLLKLENLTASTALVTDASKQLISSSVTATELGYVSGVTSAIQTQINAKQATITGAATTIVSSNLTASRALSSDASGKVAVATTTLIELNYVNGVTSAIQTQLNAKEPTLSAGTSAQYYRGDKTWQTLNQAAVAGLTTSDSVTFAGSTITKNSGGVAGSFPLLFITDAYSSTSAASAGIILKRANVASTDWSIENWSGVFYLRYGVDLTDIGTGTSALSINAGDVTIPGSLTVAALSGVLKASAGLISGSATTTDLTEGSNLYFTEARVRTALLTGFVTGAATSVLATDNVLQAFQKVQGQIDGITSASGYVPVARTITINGTTNQITSSAGAQDLSANRTWTLSLPQNIHTAATPTFGGMTLNGALSMGSNTISSGAITSSGDITTQQTSATASMIISSITSGNANLAFRDNATNKFYIGWDRTSDKFRITSSTTTNIFTQDASGNTTIAGSLTTGMGITATTFSQDNAQASVGDIVYKVGGVARWVFRRNTDVETGANAGSNFEFISRDDAGAQIQVVMKVTRSNGNVVWGGGNHSGLGTISSDLISSRSSSPSTFTRLSSLTNSANTGLFIKGETSADMVDGFGSYIAFYIRDSAAVDNEIVDLFATRNGADNTGRFGIYTSVAGVSGLRVAIDSTAFNAQSIPIQISGTTVIDTSRNLTNIGTISSGAITSSGRITAGAANDFYVGGTALGLNSLGQGGTSSVFDINPYQELRIFRLSNNASSIFRILKADGTGATTVFQVVASSGDTTISGALASGTHTITGNLTTNTGLTQSNSGYNTITGSDSHSITLYPTIAAAGYNSTNSAGDQVVLGRGATIDTGILNLTTWSATAVGVRITNNAVTITGTITIPSTINSQTISSAANFTGTVAITTSVSVPRISNLTSNGFVKTSGGNGTLSVDTSTYLTANQTITLSGDISGTGTTAITTTIGANKVTLAMMAQMATASFLGRTTAATGNVEVLSVSTVRTMLSISNVENTALSTWAGTANITTLGTIGTGTWNATAIADGKIASALTGKTYNGLTLTALATGFSIAGGTTSKTLTVSNTLTFSGTDGSTLNVGTGGTLGTAAYTATTAYLASATNSTQDGYFTGVRLLESVGATYYTRIINGSDLTAARTLTIVAGDADKTLTISASTTLNGGTHSGTNTGDQTITLTGDVTGSGTGSFATSIGANKVALSMLAQIATNSVLGRITAATGNVEVLTAANVKTILSLTNVENTALSTWAGTANITTLGTIGTGTWNATTISTAKGGTNLTSIGTANQVLGVNSGATGLEYKTINGTSNQVTVTHGANSVTLSLPQNIHTGASPTFTGLTLSGNLTVNGTSTNTIIGNITTSGAATYSLGTTTVYWANSYIRTMYSDELGFKSENAFSLANGITRFSLSPGSASGTVWYKIASLTTTSTYSIFSTTFKIDYSEDGVNYYNLAGKIRLRTNTPITSQAVEWFYDVDSHSGYSNAAVSDLMRIVKTVDDGTTVTYEIYVYSPESWASIGIEFDKFYLSGFTPTYYRTSTTATPAASIAQSAVDKYLVGDYSLKGNFLPSVDSTYDLGSASIKWNNLYSANVVSTTVTSPTIKTSTNDTHVELSSDNFSYYYSVASDRWVKTGFFSVSTYDYFGLKLQDLGIYVINNNAPNDHLTVAIYAYNQHNNSTGVFGETGGTALAGTGTNYGVHGYAHVAQGGTSTVTNIGIFGEAAGGGTNWAGYFGQGNVFIYNYLRMSGAADNTTSAYGIKFGLSEDTTLYRSAASTLKTDGALVSTSLYLGPNAGTSYSLDIGNNAATLLAYFHNNNSGGYGMAIYAGSALKYAISVRDYTGASDTFILYGDGSLQTVSTVKASNMTYVLYATDQTQVSIGAVAAVAEFIQLTAANKIRVWYRHRTGNKTVRCTALLKSAGASDISRMIVNVNGSNGSNGDVTGTTYAAATSTKDVSGLTNGTEYEILVNLGDPAVNNNAYMKQVVIEVESTI